MTREIAIFDLDSGLLGRSPLPVFAEALAVVDPPRGQLVRAAQAVYRLLDAGTGPFLTDVAVRAAVRGAAGWTVSQLQEAGERAAEALDDLVAPHARVAMDEHRGAGRRLVLTTVLASDVAGPVADRLGFDAVIATHLGSQDGTYDGTVEGPVVWGRGKLVAARAWAANNDALLARSYAYAGRLADAPLLAEVGHPTVVDPDPRMAALAWLRHWPTRSFDVPPGIPRVGPWELQEWLRPLTRPEVTPIARIELLDLEHIPASGPAIVCGNHRSYFDVVAVSQAVARSGRKSRFLGKKEVFDAPVVGPLARWLGGIRVDRGTGSDEPLEAAALALRAGELVTLMPQGTIPRGPAFFEPELKGRWGAARLAALTRAPVIPLALWGTEKVWPRSSRLPRLDVLNRPLVTVRAGPPVELFYEDPEEDTKRIMSAIADLLPPEAHERRQPTDEELVLTYPPGYEGNPAGEHERRPGRD